MQRAAMSRVADHWATSAGAGVAPSGFKHGAGRGSNSFLGYLELMPLTTQLQDNPRWFVLNRQ